MQYVWLRVIDNNNAENESGFAKVYCHYQPDLYEVISDQQIQIKGKHTSRPNSNPKRLDFYWRIQHILLTVRATKYNNVSFLLPSAFQLFVDDLTICLLMECRFTRFAQSIFWFGNFFYWLSQIIRYALYRTVPVLSLKLFANAINIIIIYATFSFFLVTSWAYLFVFFIWESVASAHLSHAI